MRQLFKLLNYGLLTVVVIAAIVLVYITMPIFGNSALIVRSGSMEPAIGVGDLVVVRSVASGSYEKGEVIAFKGTKSGVLTTHRIINIINENGRVLYETRGDANNNTDNFLVPSENIIGSYSFIIPKVGKLLGFTKTNSGFGLLIILPALFVILMEVINIFKELKPKDGDAHPYSKTTGILGFKMLLPFILSVFLIQSSYAYLSDSETSINNVFGVADTFCTVSENGPFWATTVIDVSQGTLKNGSAIISPARIDPNDVLGVNDWIPGTGTNFFSLGLGGSITVSFASGVANVDGDDLSIHEATNGRATYPQERVKIEVSEDQVTWFDIGLATSELGGGGDGVTYFDFGSTGLSFINYVRITEETDFVPHQGNADGFDLDAVDATSLCQEN